MLTSYRSRSFWFLIKHQARCKVVMNIARTSDMNYRWFYGWIGWPIAGRDVPQWLQNRGVLPLGNLFRLWQRLWKARSVYNNNHNTLAIMNRLKTVPVARTLILVPSLSTYTGGPSIIGPRKQRVWNQVMNARTLFVAHEAWRFFEGYHQMISYTPDQGTQGTEKWFDQS